MSTGANSISETFNGLVDGNINGQGSYTHAAAWSTAGTGAGVSAIVYDTGGGAKQLRIIDDVVGQRVKVGIILDSGYRSMSGYVQFDWQQEDTDFSTDFKLRTIGLDSICGITFDSDTGQIIGDDGESTFSELQAWTSGVSYTIKIVFDIAASTVSFYVDGDFKITLTLSGSSPGVPVGKLEWFTGPVDTNTVAIYDNLVFEGDAISVGHTTTTVVTISASPSVSHKVDYVTTATETITVTPSVLHKVDYVYTATDTVGITPLILDAKTLKTDYKYFLGTGGGTIHLHSQDYKGDAGVVIPCQYVTKDTDFSSQDMPSNDHWKTVYAVKVFYQDMTADTDIIIGISTNGGVTWPDSQSQTLGNGDKTRKDHTFFFIVTGQFFMFRLSSGSASTTFKFLGMEIEYEDAGPHWVIA